MDMWRYCAPCLMGMEGIVGDELKRMDAGEVRVENGRVLFSGGPELLARPTPLRCAERVQILLGTFPARSFEELFQGVKALPLGKLDRQKRPFPVKGWSLNSTLHSVPRLPGHHQKGGGGTIEIPLSSGLVRGNRCAVSDSVHAAEG